MRPTLWRARRAYSRNSSTSQLGLKMYRSKDCRGQFDKLVSSGIQGKIQVGSHMAFWVLLLMSIFSMKRWHQGDQIERIFAQCAIHYFGQFLKNTGIAHNFGLPFSSYCRICINFDKNVLGYIFGRFFHKLMWSHWAAFTCFRMTPTASWTLASTGSASSPSGCRTTSAETAQSTSDLELILRVSGRPDKTFKWSIVGKYVNILYISSPLRVKFGPVGWKITIGINKLYSMYSSAKIGPVLRRVFYVCKFGSFSGKFIEPILRLTNLQLQRQHCSRLERF
jgi:hypothetical protein